MSVGPEASPAPAHGPPLGGPGVASPTVDGSKGDEGIRDPSTSTSRRARVGELFGRLVEAIRHGDDDTVEAAVIALSQRSRWLAPLALLVGGFAMLFQGVKLLFTNWRLTLVQILPAMWIWLAMLDLKAHVLRGREFHEFRGPLIVTPIILGVATLTAASFYLNAVFAFSIGGKRTGTGPPEIRPAFEQANRHVGTILAWGLSAGALLGIAAFVSDRWGHGWFAVTMGIMTAFLMFAYVALPSRLLGIRTNQSRRDKLTASAVGGAVGAVICSPPYLLGRVALLMLGSHVFRYLAILLLVIAIILQTGATSAVKAVKMSAKIVSGTPVEAAGAEAFGGPGASAAVDERASTDQEPG